MMFDIVLKSVLSLKKICQSIENNIILNILLLNKNSYSMNLRYQHLYLLISIVEPSVYATKF